ncbi:Nuclear envelope morphology protein 1 [Spathaspora sp. JA1]|nr:Nuclear envelope morphology protein 1 [Spathaspora sp. JA1]
MNSIKLLVNSIDSIILKKSTFETPTETIIDDPIIEQQEEDDNSENSDVHIEEEDELEELEEDGFDNSINLVKSEHVKENVQDKVEEIPVSVFYSVMATVYDVLFFFPNYLIIKPGMFCYMVITFPFRIIAQQLGLVEKEKPKQKYVQGQIQEQNQLQQEEELEEDPLVTRALPSGQPTPPSDTEDYDEQTELLKQQTLISNTIKSPTSTSKYLIPPPQRLYPLSRNPERRRRQKKILILDLDETLIHSLSKGSPRSFSSSHSKMIEITLNKNVSSLYYVHKRPYCDYFLSEISKWFELQIFTASVKEYADPIINWLESDLIDSRKQQQKHKYTSAEDIPYSPKIFSKRYYRNDCTYRRGVGYIKDLSKFIKDEDLKNVLILDNSPISYSLHEQNAVTIEGWVNDQTDCDLLNLLPMLHSLSLCIDVRFILGLKSGEKLFEM